MYSYFIGTCAQTAGFWEAAFGPVFHRNIALYGIYSPFLGVIWAIETQNRRLWVRAAAKKPKCMKGDGGMN